MTDRLDADIPYVYGGYWIRPEDAKNFGLAPVDLPYDPVIVLRNKSKTVFWLVSNCSTVSKRELAVKKLSRLVLVAS
ncbi:unnamed protein product [Anisakis simplex]|uniref:SBP_bac_5 domain-containing protein n=1 Tax=Anisakis simplex TaxID=6269 RepID=A0A0M3JPY0_ANISI|nr:unnamed protein product [Anisakis simplex]